MISDIHDGDDKYSTTIVLLYSIFLVLQGVICACSIFTITNTDITPLRPLLS